MKNALKLSLLGASVLAISVPVTASHNHGLRGMFNAPQNFAHQGASPQYVAPQSWQAQRLQAQGATYLEASPYASVQNYAVNAAPQYVRTQHVGYSVAQDGLVHTQQGLQLRGFASPNAVHYDPRAQKAFFANRSANIGGVNVRTNAHHTRDMLDWQENTTGKTMTLLANRANGTLKRNSLYLGGAFQGGFKYQKTSVDGQFPILSRFPFFSDSGDDEAGVFAIDHAALSFTSTFGDWTTVYLQPEYSETEYGRDQDEFQLRKAFVVFGNLQKTPLYAAFGRKTIDFGNFDSYNAYTLNEGQHYFQAVSDQPVLEVGYYKNGLKLTASALSGGRQLRVALAGEENNIGNYAFNGEKEFLLSNGGAFTVGGGYLHDTIYRDNFTAHTFQGRQNGTPPANFIEYRNSAVNAFAEYNSDFFDAMVEYTTTLKPWAAAIPQLPDGTPFPQYLVDPTGSTTDINNISFDEKLNALVAQARIKPMMRNGRRLSIAASGSWGNISDDFGNPIFGSSFKKNQQHAFSVEYPVNDFLEFGAEYVYNKGFIPFVAPQLVSNDQTEAHAINVGFKARF
ncbi:MAG: hypothetical protein ABJN69_10490 [Hellea sp.]